MGNHESKQRSLTAKDHKSSQSEGKQDSSADETDEYWETTPARPGTRSKTIEIKVGRYNSVEGVLDDISIDDLRKHLLEAGEMHYGTRCRSCKQRDFVGYRYKCTCCKCYNLCADCFEKKRVTEFHDISHPMLFISRPIDELMHKKFRLLFDMRCWSEMNSNDWDFLRQNNKFSGTRCKYCKTEPIRGVYFKCDDCVDLEWCWSCHENYSTHIEDHAKQHSIVVHYAPEPVTFDLANVQYADREPNERSSVREVRYEGCKYALKTIHLEDYGRGKKHNKIFSTYEDIRAYMKLRCNSIVRFFGCVLREDKACLYVLMEHMPGGSLKHVIQDRRKETYRRKLMWMLQVIKGVRRMHQASFVHLDLRPSTILLTDSGNAKIGNVAAVLLQQGNTVARPGLCRFHTAPEIRLDQKYNNKVDIYSFGVVMNELFTYVERQDDNLPTRLAERSPILPRLIAACVDDDPRRRPSAEQIEEKLEDLDSRFWSSLSNEDDEDDDRDDRGPRNEWEYRKASIDERNRAFVKFYQTVKSKLGEEN